MEDQTQRLIELLSESELEHFNSLAPSYKKNFVSHAFGAKTEKTMLKNIDEVKEAMELKCKNIFEYKKKVNPPREIDENLDDNSKIALYWNKIGDKESRDKVINLYKQLLNIDSKLAPLYAWNNPMIKYNETFICGVSVAKAHLTMAFEAPIMEMFSEQITLQGYGLNLKTFTIKYNQEINFELLSEMVKASIDLKKDRTSFWY